MIIKNFEKLAISRQRKIGLQIVESGLEAVQSNKVLEDSVKLKNYFWNNKF